MKNLVIDIDKTLTLGDNKDYSLVGPNISVVNKVREYKKSGFNIILFTARNMRTHQGNIGKITAQTLPIIFKWLEKHQIPFDEIYVGKPWCGNDGFYVDDRAIRPDEFISKPYEEIKRIIDGK
jgi:capsule biosynthesis phosphatase